MEATHKSIAYREVAAKQTCVTSATPALQVKGAVCANINLLMEKEEEDFEKYLGTFATDIWTLLTTVSLEPRQVR